MTTMLASSALPTSQTGLARCGRFLFYALIKIACRFCYRFELSHVEPWPKDGWQDLRLLLLLNHTSLLEPVFFGVAPFSYLWQFAGNGAFPAADVTMARPLVGRLLGSLAPKVVILSRKRDDSWQQFLDGLEPHDCLIFMPEGRMKRANGLDKNGKPMTMRGGIVDVLVGRGQGKMMLFYSGGLHHLHGGLAGLPRLFRTIKVKCEIITIEDYLASFDTSPTNEPLKQRIMRDLEERRDRHC